MLIVRVVPRKLIITSESVPGDGLGLGVVHAGRKIYAFHEFCADFYLAGKLVVLGFALGSVLVIPVKTGEESDFLEVGGS